MTEHNIVIGSRGSRLAVIQSEMVRDFIREKKPGCQVEILTMKTTGDKILDRTLEKIGGKGLFVKELDKALLDGCSDLSVHSLKDMPMELSEELPLLAFPKERIQEMCWCFRKEQKNGTERFRSDVPARDGCCSLKSCIRM